MGFNWFSQVKKWSTKKFKSDIESCAQYIENVFSIYYSVSVDSNLIIKKESSYTLTPEATQTAVNAVNVAKPAAAATKAKKKNNTYVLTDLELQEVKNKFYDKIVESYNNYETPLLFIRKNGYIVIDSVQYQNIETKKKKILDTQYQNISLSLLQ